MRLEGGALAEAVGIESEEKKILNGRLQQFTSVLYAPKLVVSACDTSGTTGSDYVLTSVLVMTTGRSIPILTLDRVTWII